jgi:hypothetical protein
MRIKHVVLMLAVALPGLGAPAQGQRAEASAFVPAPRSIDAARAQETSPRCHRSGRHKAGQYFGALAGAWIGGILAWQAFDDPEGPDRKVKGDAGYTPNANTAFAIGSWLGATTVAIAVAPRSAGCRAWATALGTAVPTIPLLFGREEPYLPLLGVLFVAPLQALGGMVSY